MIPRLSRLGNLLVVPSLLALLGLSPSGDDAETTEPGSHQEPATRTPVQEVSGDRGPRWSPDGGRIAFVSDRNGTWDIWVMDAEGSDPRNLTDSPASDMNPRWSPDGSRIAFKSDRTGTHEIWVMDADGSDPRRVTDAPGSEVQIQWSPDGRWLAFTRVLGDGAGGFDMEVWVAEADGSSSTNLSAAGLTGRAGSAGPRTSGGGGAPSPRD